MTERINISKGTANYVNMALNEILMREDETIIHSCIFDDGTEMDIKVCGADFEPAWTEAVLFKDGCEVACSECCEELLGEWVLEHDGVEYKAIVEVA